jgi:hypothetical protein
MNTDELKERYHYLYDKMKNSREVEKMKIFGNAERKMFDKLANSNPNMAKEWLNMLEAVCWNNFLTEEQAEHLASKIVNQDHSTGPHWPMDVFFSVVPRLGGILEEEPYYNKYALWLVANAHYSDFARSTAEDMGYRSPEETPQEKMALSMYRKAVESLKDVDRVHYLTSYYML